MSFYICSYCGRDTQEKDGICVICKMNDIAKDLGLPVRKKAGQPTSLKADKIKEGRDKMAKEFKSNHRECDTEGCKKYAVKDRLCWSCWKEKHGKSPYPSKRRHKCKREGCKKWPVRDGFCKGHWNEEHGIVTKAGRKALNPSQSSSHGLTRGSIKNEKLDHPITLDDDGKGSIEVKQSYGDILSCLYKERDNLDTAIKVIERYAQ